MTLADDVRNALAGITTLPHHLDLARGGKRFQCELIGLESLACAFTRFELTHDILATASIDQLKQVAEGLSARLTYLLEPIQPIEVDPDQCIVQMRSSPPQKDDLGTSYYELLVRRGGHISLARYVKQPAAQRQSVPAHVTREVFLRLTADFERAA